jgi:hypothetical protein
MDDTPEKHLWEYDHPYYCNDYNFRARRDEGGHEDFESWADFIATWGDSDPELNLVFRWDWMKPGDKLYLFVVLQRKGDFWALEINVTDDDEPAVRAWLAERAKHLAAVWEPITLEGASNA